MNTGVPTRRDPRPLPEGAAPARLIVCERSGSWAVALRRALAEADPDLQETRSVPDAWDLLARSPASFVVAELNSATIDLLLARMAWLERDFPLARVAIVAARSWQRYQWLMRAAGAIDFVVSPRALAPLAQAIARHLRHSPQPRLSLAERIWEELPWATRRG